MTAGRALPRRSVRSAVADPCGDELDRDRGERELRCCSDDRSPSSPATQSKVNHVTTTTTNDPRRMGGVKGPSVGCRWCFSLLSDARARTAVKVAHPRPAAASAQVARPRAEAAVRRRPAAAQRFLPVGPGLLLGAVTQPAAAVPPRAVRPLAAAWARGAGLERADRPRAAAAAALPERQAREGAERSRALAGLL